MFGAAVHYRCCCNEVGLKPHASTTLTVTVTGPEAATPVPYLVVSICILLKV
jgi:hypothetical protein